ncbi:helix-turn-helix transcriptional regulator [Cnuella takakiae]|nr:helix-turn-helix transcriptional regulator [Cnuella takakiae]
MQNHLTELLKTKRLEKRLSQEDVAKAIGKSLRTYQYYEEGESMPKQETLQKLADLLGFTRADIYKDAEKLHNSQPKPNSDNDLLKALLSMTESMERLTQSRLIDSNTMSRLVSMLEMKMGVSAPANNMGLHPATSAGGIWEDALENASKKEASKR